MTYSLQLYVGHNLLRPKLGSVFAFLKYCSSAAAHVPRVRQRCVKAVANPHHTPYTCVCVCACACACACTRASVRVRARLRDVWMFVTCAQVIADEDRCSAVDSTWMSEAISCEYRSTHVTV
eukprot:6411421-Amphidinium_carterae.2